MSIDPPRVLSSPKASIVLPSGMQMSEAAQLRRNWGKMPCSHPLIVKEYDNSAQTGDYVCTTCGETHWREDEFSKAEVVT